jgi:hypothetical protein
MESMVMIIQGIFRAKFFLKEQYKPNIKVNIDIG